jgi:hypothetical protein
VYCGLDRQSDRIDNYSDIILAHCDDPAAAPEKNEGRLAGQASPDRNRTHNLLVNTKMMKEGLSAEFWRISPIAFGVDHLQEMYRRQVQDEKSPLQVRRRGKRLLNVTFELDRFATPEKWGEIGRSRTYSLWLTLISHIWGPFGWGDRRRSQHD